MRKTYAYNGITIGIILGIAAWAVSSNLVVGVIAAIVASVVCFLIIRGIENLLYKGAEKAGEAINRKLDEAHMNKTRENQ